MISTLTKCSCNLPRQSMQHTSKYAASIVKCETSNFLYFFRFFFLFFVKEFEKYVVDICVCNWWKGERQPNSHIIIFSGWDSCSQLELVFLAVPVIISLSSQLIKGTAGLLIFGISCDYFSLTVMHTRMHTFNNINCIWELLIKLWSFSWEKERLTVSRDLLN